MTIAPFDIVIFHGNCYDGFTAAWAARKHSPEAVFVPAQYGDEPPDVAGKRVLICDFSYPRDVLLRMHGEAAGLLVLDHHKTAAEDLAGLDFAVFDMERSGAGLTWDTLHPLVKRPALVSFVEDRDLWRFEFGELTRAFHAALTTVTFDFGEWDEVAAQADDRVDLVIEQGRSVLRFTQLAAEKFAARARRVMLGEREVWAVNVPVEFVSETAEVLKHREPHLPILGWSWDGERGDFYCSLRSRDDGPDVSAIAREFGGGGHEHAAGFRSPTVPVSACEDTVAGRLSATQILDLELGRAIRKIAGILWPQPNEESFRWYAAEVQRAIAKLEDGWRPGAIKRVRVWVDPEDEVDGLIERWLEMLTGVPCGVTGFDCVGQLAYLEAEALAKLFHETYEGLAPEHGYETRPESAKPWAEVTEQNRRLMVATCASILRKTGTEGEQLLEAIKRMRGAAKIILSE